MITPIFAAPPDVESLIKIGIGVVLGIGWLIKFIATKNQAAAPPPQRRAQRPPAQRDEKIKNEIEVFLQEVTGRKAPPKQAEEARPVPQATEPRRTLASPQRPATASQKPPAARTVASQPSTSASPPLLVSQETASIRPGGAISGRKGPGSKDLGKGVTSHLAEYMDEKRIEKQVQKDLQHTVNQEVRSHLGQFTAEAATQGVVGSTVGSAGATHELVKLLRNPQGVRQAILIKEVLERPSVRSRRRRG